MRKKAITFISAIFVIAIMLMGFKVINDNGLLNKPTTNDNFNFIAINQILMYVANNGDGCMTQMSNAYDREGCIAHLAEANNEYMKSQLWPSLKDEEAKKLENL